MAAFFLIGASPASAASVSIDSGVLTYNGDGGDNKVDLGWDASVDQIYVSDESPGAVITAGTGCASAAANLVHCDQAANTISSGFFTLDEGDDWFYNHMTEPQPEPGPAAFPVSVRGGDGSDQYGSLMPDKADTYDGGAGFDYVNYALRVSGGVDVNLMTTPGTGGAGGDDADTIVSTEGIQGSPFGGSLIGSSAANVIFGSQAADMIAGAGEADVLYPGAGDDFVDGGQGSDTLAWTDHGAAAINLAHQTATLKAGGETDTFAGIDNAWAGGGDDTITGDGSANELSGGGGADDIAGGGGEDVVQPGPGDDTAISGGTADDTIDYGDHDQPLTIDVPAGTMTAAGEADAFNDFEKVVGGEGDDTIRTRDGASTPTDCGAGFDTVFADVAGEFGSAFTDPLTACERVSPDYVAPQPSATQVLQTTVTTVPTSETPASQPLTTAPATVPVVKSCRVPKLKGRTLEKARALLRRANCAAGKATKKKAKGKRGTVLFTKPRAGKVLKARTKIALVLVK